MSSFRDDQDQRWQWGWGYSISVRTHSLCICHLAETQETASLLIQAPSKTQCPNKVPSMCIFIFITNHVFKYSIFGKLEACEQYGWMTSWNNALFTKSPHALSCTNEVMVDSLFNFLAYKTQSCIYPSSPTSQLRNATLTILSQPPLLSPSSFSF